MLSALPLLCLGPAGFPGASFPPALPRTAIPARSGLIWKMPGQYRPSNCVPGD